MKCPECNAYVNPAWTVCLSCGETIEPGTKSDTGAGVSEVFIKLLGETIYLAETEAEAKGIDRGRLYTRDELQVLEDAKPDKKALRLLNTAKREFEGTIVEDTSGQGFSSRVIGNLCINCL